MQNTILLKREEKINKEVRQEINFYHLYWLLSFKDIKIYQEIE